MTYDPTSPSQVKSRTRREKRKIERLHRTMQVWVSTPEGRELISYFLEEAKVFQTTFTGNGWAAFNEGARAQGLKMLTMLLEAAPQMFTLLLEESNKNLKREADIDLASSTTPEKEDASG